jgi:hypothetical protein
LNGGERIKALQEALVLAFPTEDDLKILLLPLDLRLAEISLGRSLRVMVLDVIGYCEARGRTHDLLAAACKERPRDTELSQLAQGWPVIARPSQRGFTAARVQSDPLSDGDWGHLTRFIRERRCTPVIGPAASEEYVYTKLSLATEWAVQYGYPFPDQVDLPRVAQFIAKTEYPLLPHEVVQRRIQAAPLPDFTRTTNVHGFFASLALPLYLTANQDDFMFKALERRDLLPHRGFPRWNDSLRADEEVQEPSEGTLVYHLFGHHDRPESMVVTEDDHLEFLSACASDRRLFPTRVTKALGGSSLLFIGFGVLDFGFRVLMRALLRSMSAKNLKFGVAVQLAPSGLSEEARGRVEKYLDRFLNEAGTLTLRVFWNETDEFIRSLQERLAAGA